MLDWNRLTTAERWPTDLVAPLVSCLCVTRGKSEHLRRAVACFEAQSYPNLELVVVHDQIEDESLRILTEHDDRPVRVFKKRFRSIGAQRNLALEIAQGEYFAVWDDDDWHAPGRVATQMRGILEKSHWPASVLTRELAYNETTSQAYFTSERHWEHSLVCRRLIPRFPLQWAAGVMRGEDTKLVVDLARSQLLLTLDAPELYVYTFHGQNLSRAEHHRGMYATELSERDSERISGLLNISPENMRRADGDVVCADCGQPYRKHPLCPVVRGFAGPFLNLLCSGARVKL